MIIYFYVLDLGGGAVNFKLLKKIIDHKTNYKIIKQITSYITFYYDGLQHTLYWTSMILESF